MHDESCFLYVFNGDAKLYGGLQTEKLSSEDSVIMKCGHYINQWLETSNENNNEAIAVHFYPDILEEVFDNKLPEFLKYFDQPKGVNIHKISPNEALSQYTKSLQFYFEHPSIVNEDMIKTKVKELILLLVSLDSDGKIVSILRDMFNPEKIDFKAFIHNHIFENLSLDQYADLIHMSTSTFKRKFSEFFNDSPAQYIKKYRLEESKKRLLSSTNRISDIAFDCGFNDLSSYTKSFTQTYGIPPQEFRKKRS